MLVELERLTKAKVDNVTVNVLVININKSGKKQFEYVVLGKTLSQWTAKACSDYPVTFVEDEGDYLRVAKQNISGTTYTLVINSNMPLLTRADIQNLVEYAVFKQVNLCKFTGGYVVNNKYLSTTDNAFCDSVYSANLDNFYIVENKKQLPQVTKILQERIYNYHLSNGVNIVSFKGVVIEPDVEIEQNVTICAGNVLKGNTTISHDAILKENNVVDNSYIGSSSGISGSVITNSYIGDSTFIMPFCNVTDCKIGNNTTIKSYVELIGRVIADNVTISPKGE